MDILYKGLQLYIVNFIKLQLPDSKKNLLAEIKQVFSKTIMTMLRAYGLIMFITFCELALGLSILNWIGQCYEQQLCIHHCYRDCNI